MRSIHIEATGTQTNKQFRALRGCNLCGLRASPIGIPSGCGEKKFRRPPRLFARK
jgi:hypothetical protein